MLLIGPFALLALFALSIFTSPLFNARIYIYVILSEKVFGDLNANRLINIVELRMIAFGNVVLLINFIK